MVDDNCNYFRAYFVAKGSYADHIWGYYPSVRQ